MFRIEHTRRLGPEVKLFKIAAPRVARKHRAGQFVIVRVHAQGERIPLTIAESDPEAGLITIVVQAVGKTTSLLNTLDVGDRILDVVGPLGKPSEIQDYGTAVVIGGGVGTAIAWPTARALKQAGNRVISIIGGRNQELVILLDEIRQVSDRVIVTTDDGSMGRRGLVTDALRDVLARETPGNKIGLVLAIGPVPMMRAVAELTRPQNVRTIVSLNSIMVDGTGMCGGCRVLVEGASQFACVDGPEFDAHLVNFDVLAQRNRMYRESEVAAMADFQEDPQRDYEIMRRAGQLAECALEQVAAMTVEGS
jgi:ferredoxin--NADP+ reductase